MNLGFYVYTHKRCTDGSVFYVGKGNGDRLNKVDGRSAWWKRIVSRHGYTSEIAYGNLNEPMALMIEKCLIRDIGRKQLCNMTDGGEGLCGYRATEETRLKLSLALKGRKIPDHLKVAMNKNLKKKTFCSNGMCFDGAIDAAKWLKGNGFPKARQSVVSRCADGTRPLAYGLAWSYTGLPAKPDLESLKLATKKKQSDAKIGRPARNAIRIACGNGMEFASARFAEKWLKSNGFPRACSTAICGVAKGKRNIAYGFKWFYA